MEMIFITLSCSAPAEPTKSQPKPNPRIPHKHINHTRHPHFLSRLLGSLSALCFVTGMMLTFSPLLTPLAAAEITLCLCLFVALIWAAKRAAGNHTKKQTVQKEHTLLYV